jgi:hypothetical protein
MEGVLWKKHPVQMEMSSDLHEQMVGGMLEIIQSGSL